MNTITVRGYFGKDKEMTRQEFVEVWKSHMTQLFHLSHEHYEEFKAMRDRVEEIADAEFDRLKEVQANGS